MENPNEKNKNGINTEDRTEQNRDAGSENRKETALDRISKIESRIDAIDGSYDRLASEMGEIKSGLEELKALIAAQSEAAPQSNPNADRPYAAPKAAPAVSEAPVDSAPTEINVEVPAFAAPNSHGQFAPQQGALQQGVQQTAPQPAAASVQSGAANAARPYGAQSRGAQPPGANTARPYAPQQPKPKRSGSLEQFIGKNAMGIGASLLVFIAMVMFATLLMPYMTQELKCVAMYVFSFILIGLGEWVYKKQKNAYLILSACGAGALYISIVATHVYFRFIGMIPLYALLLLWMAYSSYLGKKRSLLFVIVGQIGISIAVIMSAFGLDTPNYLYLRLGFLVVSEALYYILFFKSDYKFKLTNTIGLIASLLVFDFVIYDKHLNYAYAANRPAALILMLSVAVMAAAVIRLIAASEDKNRTYVSSITALVNGGTVYTICILTQQAVSRLGRMISMRNAPILQDSRWSYALLCLYLAAVLVALVVKERKKNYDLNVIQYVCFGMFAASLRMLPSAVVPYLIAMLMLAVVAYNFFAERQDLYYISQGVFIYGLTMAWTDKNLYAFGFMLLLSIVQMVRSREKNPMGVSLLYEILSYLSGIVAIMTLVPLATRQTGISTPFLNYCATIALFIAVQLAARKWNWMNNNENKLGVFHFANLFMMLSAVVGMRTISDTEIIVEMLLAAGIFSINVRSLLRIKKSLGAYVAAKYSFLVGLLMFKFNAPNQIFSIVFLLIAISCVVIGFKIQNKSIRLYGLVLSMISIFKLIVIDITYTNTLMRAVSFLVSGLICFGISLVYNRIDKQQNAAGEVAAPDGIATAAASDEVAVAAAPDDALNGATETAPVAEEPLDADANAAPDAAPIEQLPEGGPYEQRDRAAEEDNRREQ